MWLISEIQSTNFVISSLSFKFYNILSLSIDWYLIIVKSSVKSMKHVSAFLNWALGDTDVLS